MQVAIRPENLRVTPVAPGSPSAPGTVPGKIADVTFLGNLVDCHVMLEDGFRVRVQVDPAETLEVGRPVSVRLDGGSVSVFES